MKLSSKRIGLIGAFFLGIGLYRYRRQILTRLLRLGAVRYPVSIQRGLRVKMFDGVELITDHYAPESQRLLPTILIRTPYGRNEAVFPSGLMASFPAQRFAERGYNVIVQDVRGRFDSGGEFEPFVNEKEDGRATLKWIEEQPWFNGVLGMWGPSYLGYVQWAVAVDGPLYLKALAPSVTGSRLPLMGIRDGAVQLDTIVRWILELDLMQRNPLSLHGLIHFLPGYQDRILARSMHSLPLVEIDQRITGKEVSFYRDWLKHRSMHDPYWEKVDLGEQAKNTTAAVHLISGWYDILLREALSDYEILPKSEHSPYLTIGPWGHINAGGMWESLRQDIAWFDAYLKGDRSQLREKPVRLYVMGQNEWREYTSWPLPMHEKCYYLGASDRQTEGKGVGLSSSLPLAESLPDSYLYDPSDPTPAVGGNLMSIHLGSRDNRSLEARQDVLTFSTAPLEQDLEIIGAAHLDLYATSSNLYCDYFARLCDVYPDGRSMNVCDGFLRLNPEENQKADGDVTPIRIDLWPTAYRFKAGHRLRLQISSGAHPRWNRNPGTGEPIMSATRLLSSQHNIYHDRAHPSVLILPESCT